MNVFSTIQNSTSNLFNLGLGSSSVNRNGSNSSLNGSQAGENTPPHLLYFTIVNPNLIDGNAEDTETLLQQIVTYINFEHHREVTDNEKIKRIGIIQGLNDFSLKFLSSPSSIGSNLTHIDTDKSRIIVGRFEGEYWFICGFRFAKIGGTYVQRGLALPEYLINELKQGYKLWRLNHGSFKFNQKNADFKEDVGRWWKIWLNNRFEFDCNFNLNDKGFLNLIDGYRASSVQMPVGFHDNLKNKITSFIDSNKDLKEVFILNTNWTPSKNFGVIHINDTDSCVAKESLVDLINYLERLDSSFGLSTYSLTLDNLPSLKSYMMNLKRLNSIATDGTLLERSLLQPAIFLHETISAHVFDPFNMAYNTVSSITSSVMNPSRLLPRMNILGVGTAAPTAPAMEQDLVVDGRPTTGNTLETTTSKTSIDRVLSGQTKKTGNYLLGNTKDESIVSKKYHMKVPDSDEDQVYDIVIYETNGILFGLLFEDNCQSLQDLAFYKVLEQQMDEIFEDYFKDLIFSQLKDLELNFKAIKQPRFHYIVHDTQMKSYKTSLPNIPEDEELKSLKVAASEQQALFNYVSGNRSQLINLNINLLAYLTNDTKLLSLENAENLTKLNKNWWCLFKALDRGKNLILLKKFNYNELDFDSNDMINTLGDDVTEWYETGLKNGLL
ncbi:hypothetical protein CANARDRAFT_21134 [[Candida] arabinofermentans NRRL YB-2248]|uniref:CCZ1/INTU/HSP4 first Longin domain-containing protein n=1 Tax=[Candida] arabinofermentans NRRL YB-2248 TaxID=983967 RepID=A0A1E4T5X8_9ASCO|nr:hypothetical protein CANARDRAFT_21134 [[Candida] arabinofermentans NRRL YB-2248]